MGQSEESPGLFSSNSANRKTSGNTASSSSTYFSGAELQSFSGSDCPGTDSDTPCTNQLWRDVVDCRPVPLLHHAAPGQYELNWPRHVEVIHHGQRQVMLLLSQTCSDEDGAELTMVVPAPAATLPAAVCDPHTGNCEPSVNLPAAGPSPANHSVVVSPNANLHFENTSSGNLPDINNIIADSNVIGQSPSEVVSQQYKPQGSHDRQFDMLPCHGSLPEDMARAKRRQFPLVGSSSPKRPALSAECCGDGTQTLLLASDKVGPNLSPDRLSHILNISNMDSAMQEMTFGENQMDCRLPNIRSVCGHNTGTNSSDRSDAAAVVGRSMVSGSLASVVTARSTVSSGPVDASIVAVGSAAPVDHGIISHSSTSPRAVTARAGTDNVAPSCSFSSLAAHTACAETGSDVSCAQYASSVLSYAVSRCASSTNATGSIYSNAFCAEDGAVTNTYGGVLRNVAASSVGAGSAIARCVVAVTDSCHVPARTAGDSGGGSAGADDRVMEQPAPRRDPSSEQCIYHNGCRIDSRRRSTRMYREALHTKVNTVPCVVILNSSRITLPKEGRQLIIYK